MLLVSMLRKLIKPAFIRVNPAGEFLSQEDFASVSAALKNPGAFLPLDAVDFGASFSIHLEQVKAGIPEPRILEIKNRCVSYLTTLCQELVSRLPSNAHLYDALRYLAPDECSRPYPHRPNFFKLPLFLKSRVTQMEAIFSRIVKVKILRINSLFIDFA